jgi:hypothetical protein
MDTLPAKARRVVKLPAEARGNPPLSELCAKCKNLTTNEEDALDLLSGSPISFRSRDEVTKSYLAGCPICTAIYSKLYFMAINTGTRVWCEDVSFVAVTKEGSLDHIRVEGRADLGEGHMSAPVIVTHMDIYTTDGQFTPTNMFFWPPITVSTPSSRKSLSSPDSQSPCRDCQS